MPGLAVGAALDALFTMWSGADLPNVGLVVDAMVPEVPATFLAVGWDRTDSPAVTGVSVGMDYGDSQGLETFEVSSLLSFSYEIDQLVQARADVMTAFTAADAALAQDRLLGGAVMQAWVTSYDVTQMLTEEGAALAELRFTVTCTAAK